MVDGLKRFVKQEVGKESSELCFPSSECGVGELKLQYPNPTSATSVQPSLAAVHL